MYSLGLSELHNYDHKQFMSNTNLFNWVWELFNLSSTTFEIRCESIGQTRSSVMLLFFFLILMYFYGVLDKNNLMYLSISLYV